VRSTKARPVVISALTFPNSTAALSHSWPDSSAVEFGNLRAPTRRWRRWPKLRCRAGNAGRGSSDPPSGTVLAPQGRPAIKGKASSAVVDVLGDRVGAAGNRARGRGGV
jgi:hypothetical protein